MNIRVKPIALILFFTGVLAATDAVAAQFKGTIKDKETNQPLAGTVVEVYESTFSWVWRSTVANETGNYTFNDLYDNCYYSVYVSSAGYARNRIWQLYIQNPTIRNFELPPEGVITGQITDKNTGQPIENVSLAASGSSYGAYGSYGYGNTDSSGNFRIDGLVSGIFSLLIYKTDYANKSCRIVVTSGQQTIQNIELAAGGRIAGRVADKNDNPMANVSVSADGWRYGGGWGGSATTDSAGIYTISGVPEGFYDATASLGGFITEKQEKIDVKDAEIKNGVNFTLRVGGSISGVVRDGDGNPVPSAGVNVSGNDSWGSATTGANGRYTVSGLKSGYYYVSVYQYDAGYLYTYRKDIAVSVEQETLGTDFTLVKGGSISGKVSFNGNPAATAYVAACGPSWGSANIDANGNYTIKGLSAGKYRVIVRAQDYSQAMKEDIAVTLGQSVSGTNFQLNPGAKISGRITTSGGVPVAGASVSAYSDASSFYYWGGESATSDADGAYEMSSLTQGDAYRIYVWPDYNSNYLSAKRDSVKAPASNINFTLGVGGQISGQVVDPDGHPLPNIGVSAYTRPWKENGYGWATTDANGNFTIRQLSGGNYVVETDGWSIMRMGYIKALQKDVNVAAGNIVTLLEPLRVKQGVTISGIIKDSYGMPVEGASVYAWATAGGAGESGNWFYSYAYTTSAGTYTLLGISPDVEGYEVSAYYYGSAKKYGRQSLYGVEPFAQDADLALPIADATLTGRVVNSKGEPIPDTSINVVESIFGGGQSAYGYTNADGNFYIDGVVPGAYTVTVWPRDYAMETLDGVVFESKQQVQLGDITVTKGGSLAGQVLDNDGNPYQAAYYVMAFTPDFTRFASQRWDGESEKKDKSGFVIPNIALGEYHQIGVMTYDSDVDFFVADEAVIFSREDEKKTGFTVRVKDNPPIFYAEMICRTSDYLVSVFVTESLKETSASEVVQKSFGGGSLTVSQLWDRCYRAVYGAAPSGETMFGLKLSGTDMSGQKTEDVLTFAIGADAQRRQVLSTVRGGTVKIGGKDATQVKIPPGTIESKNGQVALSITKVDTRSKKSASAPSRFSAPLYPLRAPAADENQMSAIYKFELSEGVRIKKSGSVTLQLQYDKAEVTNADDLNVWWYVPSMDVWSKVDKGRQINHFNGTIRVETDHLSEFAVFQGSPRTSSSNSPLAIHNFPNPWKITAAEGTTFRYNLPRASWVTLRIYNMAGELVKILTSEYKSAAGVYDHVWYGENDAGDRVASGVYIYHLDAKDCGRITKKMAFIK